MYPLITYYGGKQRMAGKIVPLLPRHTVYVEPFAGSAAIMFAKPWLPTTRRHYREVLNDLSGELVNLYRVVRDPTKGPELVRLLQLTPYARSEHACTRQIDVSDNDIERAWAYYVNIQMSFSHRLHGGWRTGVFNEAPAATWLKKIERLPDYLGRLCGVHIECDDAINIIKRWDSPQTLFYCDPPYPDTFQGHYAGYTQDEFAALVAALSACQGSFVLSCYPNAAVPADWERFEFRTRCSASGQGRTGTKRDKTRAATAEELGDRTRTEVVWRVDRSDSARDEIKEIWRRWGWAKGAPMPGEFNTSA